MSNETWKPVVGFEDQYEVSSNGQVRGVDRVTTREHRGRIVQQPVKGRILRTVTTKFGHQTVALCRNGSSSPKYVHELVAAAFIGPRPPKHQICHNDGNGTNNSRENLRYDTPVGNASDRHRHGTDAVGTNNPANVHSEEKVRQVKEALKTKTNAEVSREFDMHPATVSGIKLGTIWGHLDV